MASPVQDGSAHIPATVALFLHSGRTQRHVVHLYLCQRYIPITWCSPEGPMLIKRELIFDVRLKPNKHTIRPFSRRQMSALLKPCYKSSGNAKESQCTQWERDSHHSFTQQSKTLQSGTTEVLLKLTRVDPIAVLAYYYWVHGFLLQSWAWDALSLCHILGSLLMSLSAVTFTEWVGVSISAFTHGAGENYGLRLHL